VDWIQVAQDKSGQVTVSCEHGNDPLLSIKFKEFLDPLSDFKLLNEEATLPSYV
jgi:hypothetical protein